MKLCGGGGLANDIHTTERFMSTYVYVIILASPIVSDAKLYILQQYTVRKNSLLVAVWAVSYLGKIPLELSTSDTVQR